MPFLLKHKNRGQSLRFPHEPPQGGDTRAVEIGSNSIHQREVIALNGRCSSLPAVKEGKEYVTTQGIDGMTHQAWTGALLMSGLLLAVPIWATDVVSETLLKTTKSWDGAPYTHYPAGQPEITVLRIYVPPHSALAWHYHPVINAAYVLTGEITVERCDNGQTQVARAGQTLPEMVNDLHRGHTDDQSATLIVFYAGEEGKAVTVPAEATASKELLPCKRRHQKRRSGRPREVRWLWVSSIAARTAASRGRTKGGQQPSLMVRGVRRMLLGVRLGFRRGIVFASRKMTLDEFYSWRDYEHAIDNHLHQFHCDSQCTHPQ